jgi:peroxiredoxin Q/BCP
LRQRNPEFESEGADIVAVSPDSVAATRTLVERLELPFTVLSDPELGAVDAYQVRHDEEPRGRLIPRPSVFVINPQGTIEYVYVGENPSDRPAEDELLAVIREGRRAGQAT